MSFPSFQGIKIGFGKSIFMNNLFSFNLLKVWAMLACLLSFLAIYQQNEHFLKKCLTEKKCF